MSVTEGTAVRLWAPGRRSVILGVLGLLSFIAFESFAVTTALPVVARDLGAEHWYSLAFAATLTTALIGMRVGGSWADRHGPARPLFWGGLMFLTGIGLCVAAPNMGVFVLGRLLQGIGGGVDSVVLYVIIARTVPEGLRPRMFGLLTTAWLLPSIAGPLASGALVEAVHWRVVFAVVLVGAAVSLSLLMGAVRGLNIPEPTVGSTVRPVLWAVAAAATALGLHVAGQQEGLFAVVGTGSSALVLVAVASRLLPRGTLTAHVGIPRLVAVRGLLGASVVATDIYLASYLQYELGHSPTLSGLVIAVGALGWAAGAWVQGRLPEGEGTRPFPLWPSTVLILCGPVSAVALVLGSVSVAVVASGCVLMGAGMGSVYPRLSSLVLALSPRDEQGSNSSALQIGESLGTSVLVGLAGTVLAVTAHGYTIVYAMVGAATTTALVLTLRTWRKGHGPRRSQDAVSEK